MPIHDWTRVPAGLFHDFHQSWTVVIKNALNRGLLPKGLAALVEQRSSHREGDVLAIETRADADMRQLPTGGAATLDRPTARIERRAERQHYAQRANRIVVRHNLGDIVAVIEIVSPGNKDSVRAFREFTDKIVGFLDAGIHVLVVDLFPPTRRDPFGIHKAIWDQVVEEEFDFPKGFDRIAVSYDAGSVNGDWTALVEPLRLGSAIPDMPLFLLGGLHVKVPLEGTYRSTWDDTPDAVRQIVLSG